MLVLCFEDFENFTQVYLIRFHPLYIHQKRVLNLDGPLANTYQLFSHLLRREDKVHTTHVNGGPRHAVELGGGVVLRESYATLLLDRLHAERTIRTIS